MTETLSLAFVLIPCLVIAIVFHEVAHGYAALALGDPTAKEQERLSLNPIRHVDPVGTLLVPGALALAGAPVFGWAKPVPVLKHRLNNPRFGMMAVAAAGPGINFLLALVGAVALGVFHPEFSFAGVNDGSDLLGQGLFYFILINVFLGVFNLLPIPPFDGSHIVEGALPAKLSAIYAKLRPFGMILFFALIAAVWFAPELRIFERTVGAPVNWVLFKYLGLASDIAN
jgi:Zn-dependent protease